MNQEEALLESLRRHDDGLLMSSDRKWIRGMVLKTFTSLIGDDPLPSVNLRKGKPYNYCPECGREEPPETKESE